MGIHNHLMYEIILVLVFSILHFSTGSQTLLDIWLVLNAYRLGTNSNVTAPPQTMPIFWALRLSSA